MGSSRGSPLDQQVYLLDLKVYVPVQQQIVENVVTDPYSIDLALNGTKSRITDLEEEATEPPGWNSDRAPRLADKTDLSIYELHIRDFSENDATVPAKYRGTYLAFTNPETNGMRHLHALPNPASRRCTCCRASTSPA